MPSLHHWWSLPPAASLHPTAFGAVALSTAFVRAVGGLPVDDWRSGTDPLAACSVCDVLHQETDFVCEARNSDLVAQDFASLPNGGGVHVPGIHWDHTTKRVMTMEWIDGVPISDLTKLRSQGYSIQELARVMVESFSHQIFVSGFVHADPHPGNILVR